MLLGGRWVLEYANRGKIFKKMNVEKHCAREVALAVAENINPGLTLTGQKETLLRVADEIYNKMPAYGDNNIPNAIPGLQSPIYEKKKDGKNYDPMVIGVKEYQSFAPDVRQVHYKTAEKYVYRHAFSGAISVGEVFRRVYFLKKNSKITDECAIIDFLPYIDSSGNNKNVYSFCSFHKGTDTNAHVLMPYLICSNSSQLRDPNYKERENKDDAKVQIAIDNDRIKAKTDNDIAYAKPAECNVDIVITVPTNMAACNKDNKNENPTVLLEDTKDTVASDTLASNQSVKNFRATPIYQIALAYHYFLQHFLHTRGTNVGLVPYSGKLSLPPDCADKWSQSFPAFSWPDITSDSSTCNLVGSLLYGTVGTKGTALNTHYTT